MANKTWQWADLNEKQLDLVKDAEESLEVDYLLAFQAVEQRASGSKSPSLKGAHVAQLTESQLECLQGLEAQIEATLVAYEK